MMERINKYIASCGVCSRLKAEQLVKDGKVKVNGQVIYDLATKISEKDVVLVNNKQIFKEDKLYILCNKPKSVVTTCKDEKNRQIILDILPEEYKKYRLYPVGRLDYDTKGVIILTNDGQLANKLIHPRYQIPKEYQVRINGIYSLGKLLQLQKGINVIDDNKKTYFVKPLSVEIVEKDKQKQTTLLKITITEGKNHEVKNIFKTQGFEVLNLTRTKFAFLTTDIDRGTCRLLKVHEIKKLYGLTKSI